VTGRALGAGAGELPTEVRKAALLLHTLEPGDRAWLVERLAEPERTALRPLLTELGTLGIPADRGLVEEVVAVVRGAPAAPKAGPAPDAAPPAGAEEAPGAEQLRTIELADPARLAAILRGEPPGLIVKLLALRPWPWTGAVLAQLRPAVARELEEALARRQPVAQVPPLLASHLLGHLAERLRDPEVARAAPPGGAGGGWIGRAARMSGALSWVTGVVAGLLRTWGRP
jgi:hypothetical protein